MIGQRRRYQAARRLGRVYWRATQEPNENNPSAPYPGLGRWYIYGDMHQDSGDAQRPASGVTTEQAHSGTQSGKMTIETAEMASGCRSFLSTFTRAGLELYYSFWLYQPQWVHVDHWQNMQFKAKQEIGGSADGVAWALRVATLNETTMLYYLTWDLGMDTGVEGPHAGEDFTSTQYQVLNMSAVVPIGRWYNIEAYLKQSIAFDGRITIWLDGVKIYDEDGIRTRPNNNWVNTWSITNYGILINPTGTDLYFDDVAIGSGRLWGRT